MASDRPHEAAWGRAAPGAACVAWNLRLKACSEEAAKRLHNGGGMVRGPKADMSSRAPQGSAGEGQEPRPSSWQPERPC